MVRHTQAWRAAARAWRGWLPAIAWLAVCAAPCARGQEEDLRSLEEAAVRAAVAGVASSVVRIETFGGLEQVEGQTVSAGPTTGVVVAPDGLIVASAFNFVQQPASILVTLPDGGRAAAEIVARDESRMLVLLKANVTAPLPVPTAVPLNEIRVGQWSIAVGRTFAAEQPNLSVGVISALHRIWGKALQTDAKVSPANYGGPLIDIRGRVLGILVPLSPQSQDELAGAEWYDSGIGFAVPLADILSRLDTWRSGTDLRPGILGIALKGENDYTDEAIVGVVRVNSPAEKAGLRADDKIVRIDDMPVTRLAHLKHALGRHYAGDSVALEVQRGDQNLSFSVPLVDRLIPYAHPFLGILPQREPSAEPGVVVRFVYPDSPAAKAGIAAGDRLVAWQGAEIANIAGLEAQIVQHVPGDSIGLRLLRGQLPREVSLTLGTLPEVVPGELPPPADIAGELPTDRAPAGKVQVRVPEAPNECWAYVPDGYDPRRSYGLLVWLHANGEYELDATVAAWRELCARQGIIVLLPRAAEDMTWRPTELDTIRKTIEQTVASYNIDRRRIVLGGRQVGGALAYLAAFGWRDLVRGLLAVDAALPPRVRMPDNEPLRRLAVLTLLARQSRLAPAVEAGVAALREQKFPVTVFDQPGATGGLTDEVRAAIARWIDSLDRL